MPLQDMQKNIRHVVHLMLENRGFDTLLGWVYDPRNRPKVHIPPLRPNEQEFYGIPQDGNNNPTYWLPDDPSYYGKGPFTFKKKFIHRGNFNLCFMPFADPGEGWDDVARQIYGPKQDMSLPREMTMRGFFIDFVAHKLGFGSNDDILATSILEDLSVINTLAQNFAVSDMWFSSAPTETNPNRAFSLGGSSQGRKNNHSFIGVPYDTLRTIFGVFGDTGNSWRGYADFKWYDDRYFTQYMFPLGMNTGSFGDIGQFVRDVATDSLPTFSYIEPIFFTETPFPFYGSDYHPPGSLFDGETFLAHIYNILVSNPAVFNKTLLIVTFDEHGGTFDHELPPPAIDPVNVDPPFVFGRYGVRVPTLLISPCVPAGSIFRADYYPEAGQPQKLPYDHTSVLATLMKWRNIPYTSPTDIGWLGRRTASAPTFENVFGPPTTNTNTPVARAFRCRDFDLETRTSEEPRIPEGLFRQMITRITGFEAGSPELDALTAQVLAAGSEQERKMRILAIRNKLGTRLRDVGQSS